MSKMCIMQYLSSFFQAFNARFMEILDLPLQNLLIMMVFLIFHCNITTYTPTYIIRVA
jgi:hypothetical protein